MEKVSKIQIGYSTYDIQDKEARRLIEELKNNGMAGGDNKKVLQPEDGNATLTQNDINEPNTTYVIQYNFDLNGETIEIPEGCTIQFDGGILDNGTIKGNNTVINAGLQKIFGEDIVLDGTWSVIEGYVEWFGIVPNEKADATPFIQKLTAVKIPVRFQAGTYYLTECLLNGKDIVLRGAGSHYKEGTEFKAFYPRGQRFIVKFGGRDDFENPGNFNQVYKDIWCSNFIIDGIRFNTYDTYFINADASGEAQNYAAICFDWAVEGFVNIKHGGRCPGVFIANSWEIYFESIVLYGSYTSLDESAMYIGKAYTNYQGSNVSAITIDNLFAETVYGKVIDCHKSPNIADLCINNIEFEPYAGDPNLVSHRGAEAYAAINSGIRDMDVVYYFNFSPENTIIHSLTYCATTATYKNGNQQDAYARGLLKANSGYSSVHINNISIVGNNVATVIGAVGAGIVNVDTITTPRWSGENAIYTVTEPIEDFGAISDDIQLFVPTGNIIIKSTQSIIDKDKVKTYKPGLIFDADTIGEVATIKGANYEKFPFDGKMNGANEHMIMFKACTLDRKFKFDGNRLVFYFTGSSKWNTDNAVITYYKGAEVVNTDHIRFEQSNVEILKQEYNIYNGEYDYCTIRFTNPICLSRVVLEDGAKVSDPAVLNPEAIGADVKSIMNHYSANDIYKQTALQCFFDQIGDIKNKLNHLILPIFASDVNEAIYDAMTGTQFLNINGTNKLLFNNNTKRVYVSVQVDNQTGDWKDVSYSMYNPADPNFDGALTVMSTTDDIGGPTGGEGIYLYAFVTKLNTSSVGYFTPNYKDNTKIVGGGYANYFGKDCLIRLGDTRYSDRITYMDSLPQGWDNKCQIFGKTPEDDTKGIRILASTDRKLTVKEAKILRDAVINLDNKYFA